MKLQEYSTCFELIYIEDNKGNHFSLWAFPEENIVRSYYNGHYTHDDRQYMAELPKFPEV